MKKTLKTLCLALAMMLAAFSAVADEWVCTNCGKTNTRKFCIYCGTKKSEQWVCPSCNAENEEEALYCGECGAKKPDTASAAAGVSVAVGDHITLGHYPQTASGADSTPIEWRVLDVHGDKALVISEYGLDTKPYHTEKVDITWEQCTLRAWLNGKFLNAAFSASEQAAILTTAVDNSRSQHYSGYSDTYKNYTDTRDKIFLLSYAEAHEYFGVNYYGDDKAKGFPNKASRAEPTAYAIAQGAYIDSDYQTSSGKAAGWWWLRSPGGSSDYASDVVLDGSFFFSNVDCTSGVIRPAFWLDLSSSF